MKKLLYLLGLSLYCVSAQAQNTLAGNLTVQQTIKLTGSLTPPTITSSVNDYAPTGFATAAVVRIQSDVPRSITGLAGGAAGRMVWLTNVGTQAVTLATESASSTAANRFSFGSSSFDLLPGASISIWYDTTSSRWRAATNLAAGGGGTTVDQTARDAAAAAQATADSKQAALANATTLAKVTEAAGLPLWDGAAWPGGGSGGTGTVTSVSVVTANGVSGSVANASTTPAITLSLGAITPTSVAASGTVTGSNLSGTNTGDQTSVTGNAGTATKLATARTINGVSFDGTAAITVPAAAGTLTGTTLASGVTASSLTSAAGGSFGTAAFTASTAYDSAGAAAAITLAGLGGVPTSRTVNGHALTSNVSVTPSDLSLAIGTNTQAWSAKLDTVAALAAATGWLHNDGAGALGWSTPSKSDIGLGAVENTPLSTWTGSANLATVGTITSGTWHGAAVADTYIASASAWNAKVSFPGFGTTGTTAVVGNDVRLSDARTPTAHNQAWSTITTTPTTLSGYGITDAQGLDADLTAVAGLSTAGLVARTGAGTAAARTITGTADQVIVANGDGVAGNPTLSLPQSIATGSMPMFGGLDLRSSNQYSPQLKIRNTSDGGAPYVVFEKYRSSNNPVLSGDPLGTILFTGWQNGALRNAFSISAIVDSAPSGDVVPAGLAFSTPTGEAMRIGSSGNVGIGTTSPAARLDLGSGAVGVKMYCYRCDMANSGLGTDLSGAGYELALFAGGASDTNGRISFGRRRVDTGTYTERMVIDAAAGNVGIGTTTPATSGGGGDPRTLEVQGSGSGVPWGQMVLSTANVAGAGEPIGGIEFAARGVSTNPRGGYIYCFKSTTDTTNAVSSLEFGTCEGASTVSRMTISGAGVLRFNAYGAGTLVTDSSGNVTASSDARLKNVSGKFTRGLDAIMQIQPKVYTWTPESGMNPDDVNVGFIAQDVQDAIPEAVGIMKTSDTEEDDGTGKKVKKSKREASEYLTLSDRPIIATLVNAVKELKVKNDELEARIKKLEAKK